jgi:hypothetical protein
MLHKASPEERRAFSREYGLDQGKADELWDELDAILDLFDDGEVEPRSAFQDKRSAARRQMRTVIKHLKKAEGVLAAPIDKLDFFTGAHLPQILKNLLSREAAVQLFGVHFEHRRRGDMTCAPPGSESPWNIAVRPWIEKRIERLTHQHHLVLTRLTITALRTGLEECLQDRTSRGGPPKDRVRQYVLHSIIQWYVETCSLAPASRETSQFTKICASIFDAIGLSTDGIAKLIQRELLLLSQAGRIPIPPRDRRRSHRKDVT